jgi:uncharacterized protein (TIGR03435 family)
MRSILMFCLAVGAVAQSRPAFDVASVKASDYKGGPLRVTARVDADGINFTNVALRQCIQRAYGLKPYQLVVPDWAGTERFMIVAKASGPMPQEKLLEMLQTLLADRFKLVFHREKKEMPVYALVVAKGGVKAKEDTSEGPSDVGEGDGDDLLFERVTMGILTGVLARSVDRPILDETGLKARYTFKLSWAEQGRMRPAGAPPAEAGESSDAPSVFTALQERLGLKLEPKRGLVEMFLVDHVERPAGN